LSKLDLVGRSFLSEPSLKYPPHGREHHEEVSNILEKIILVQIF